VLGGSGTQASVGAGLSGRGVAIDQYVAAGRAQSAAVFHFRIPAMCRLRHARHPAGLALLALVNASAWAQAPTGTDAARLEDNKALVRGYLTEVSNAGNLAAAPRYFAPDVSFNGSRDLRPFIAFRQALRSAFPDHRLSIVDQVAEGDRVVTRVRFEATHLQPFAGVAATGRRLSYSGVAIDRIVDGKVVEMWHMANPLDLPEQLKALLSAPSSATAGAPARGPD
jgi:predicted ester cyclase